EGSAGRVCMSPYSLTVRAMIEYLEPVLSFVSEGEAGDAALSAEASDLQFGNPQEMPLPEIQQARAKWAAPQNKDWFAYKFSDPKAIQVAVESLRKLTGIDFDPADVSMTTGAFGGLASTLRAVLDPGDEVIYLSPPWFFYVPMIISNGANAIRVDFEPPKFELPVDAIEWHITSRTRAIIINTPHNPSGRVFTPDELEKASVDVAALQRRRDRIVGALDAMGYETVKPEGTFYVLVRSPLEDDVAFTKLLAKENVYVLPGRLFELPRWFRISLTGNDDMDERALPGFERALDSVRLSKLS